MCGDGYTVACDECVYVLRVVSEHYGEAARLAALAAKRLSSKDPFAHENAGALTALAQVHATLATVTTND